jgi:hypothetical protein
MIDIAYLDKKDIIRIKIVGGIVNQEIRQNLQEIASTYKDRDKLYIIADYSEGWIKADPNFFLANLDAVREVFMQYFTPFEQYYNAYVIKADDPHGTEFLIRQFLKLIENVKTFHPAFFQTYDEAEEWLLSKQIEE